MSELYLGGISPVLQKAPKGGAEGEIKRVSRTNPASVFSLGGISPVLQKAPKRGAAGEIKRVSRTNPARVFYLV